MSFYHEGQRALQDAFDSRRIADRLEQVTLHERLHEGDRDFIGRCAMFFLATVDDEGCPDVSYKGGHPGFVQVLSDEELAFPHYDGNGMFRSMGNVLAHPEVALLFVDFERPDRMRVHGRAEVVLDEPLVAHWPGAQAAVRVRIDRVFPNCPRYVHRMTLQHPSPYLPREGAITPEPEWKQMEIFRDALPGTDPQTDL